MNVHGDGVELLGLVGLGIMVNLVAALWACGVAMFLRTEQAGALIQMPVFVAAVPRAGVRSAAPADRLDPRRRPLQSGDRRCSRPARSLLAGSPVKVALAFLLLAASAAVMALWARRGLASAERAG